MEFALTALVLYLLVAGGLELGRMIFVAQVLQGAARLAARELSVTPLSADYATLDEALADPQVVQNIWNPSALAIDLDCYASDDGWNGYVNSLPVLNRALRPVFIADVNSANGHRILHYPGLLVASGAPVGCPAPAAYNPATPANPWGLNVAVNVLTDGVPQNYSVLQETNPGDFSAKGFVEVTLNYPFQAAALSDYRSAGVDGGGAPNPNLGNVVMSDDPEGTPVGLYTGPSGLGNQYALGETVRPFQTLLTGQAIFRREVIAP